MRILSFNVNSLRAICTKMDLAETLKKYDCDVIMFQETKFSKEEDNPFYMEGYENFIYLSERKKGYSGTMISTRIKPLSVKKGLPSFNDEGRTLILEFENCYIINTYSPNSKDDLSRIPYRMEYDKELSNLMKELKQSKPVIIGGDLNVAPEEIDLKNPKTNHHNAGFTDEERNSFRTVLTNEIGMIDSFRYKYPDKIMYSWWSYRANARAKNVGWRIDHLLISENIKDKLVEIEYLNEVMGSDHCPVVITLDL